MLLVGFTTLRKSLKSRWVIKHTWFSGYNLPACIISLRCITRMKVQSARMQNRVRGVSHYFLPFFTMSNAVTDKYCVCTAETSERATGCLRYFGEGVAIYSLTGRRRKWIHRCYPRPRALRFALLDLTGAGQANSIHAPRKYFIYKQRSCLVLLHAPAPPSISLGYTTTRGIEIYILSLTVNWFSLGINFTLFSIETNLLQSYMYFVKIWTVGSPWCITKLQKKVCANASISNAG